MWGKSLAAFFLGMPLAVVLVGLPALLSGNQSLTTLPLLLLYFPVWIGVMALAFAFRSGARAWLWMGGAMLLGFAAMYFLKASGLVRIAG